MNIQQYLLTRTLNIKTTFLTAFFVINFSCSDFIDIDPPKTEIVTETVFSNDQSAVATIRGIYSLMMTNQSFTNAQIEKYTGLSSDELVDYSGRDEQLEFFQNSISTSNPVVRSAFWKEAYNYINNANNILEGINKSKTLSLEIKNQLEGEAKFIRAFCHFYLVNLYGEVPYIVSSDYRENAVAERLSVISVYQRIEDDLLDAQALLRSDFMYSKNERIQPNKGAAIALLARLYLYTEQWVKAEEFSSIVINDPAYTLVSLGKIFLANSNEAIWQLQPVTPEKSTGIAKLFILQGLPTDVVLNTAIFESFEDGDQRQDVWIGSLTRDGSTFFYPAKYKVYSGTSFSEYSTVLRIGEQYLIRAEARAHQENLAESANDLNRIRSRADLPSIETLYPSITREQLLLAIEQERKIEFFAEWGHRWFDLKRTKRANDVLGSAKEDWQPTDILYPIPQSERLLNSNLSQNDGY
jgi:starch-binding outer membrane protein, SusD/RagB family